MPSALIRWNRMYRRKVHVIKSQPRDSRKIRQRIGLLKCRGVIHPARRPGNCGAAQSRPTRNNSSWRAAKHSHSPGWRRATKTGCSRSHRPRRTNHRMRGNAAMRTTTAATHLCLSKYRNKKESYNQRKTAHMKPLSTEPPNTYTTYTYRMPHLPSGFHRDQLRRCQGGAQPHR